MDKINCKNGDHRWARLPNAECISSNGRRSIAYCNDCLAVKIDIVPCIDEPPYDGPTQTAIIEAK